MLVYSVCHLFWTHQCMLMAICLQLLRSLATQAMSVASYFSTGSLSQEHFFHYGLALQRYTHFTSPIRRYADILVHRQLLAAIGLGSVDDLPGNTALQEMADHINNRHKVSGWSQLGILNSRMVVQFLLVLLITDGPRCSEGLREALSVLVL